MLCRIRCVRRYFTSGRIDKAVIISFLIGLSLLWTQIMTILNKVDSSREQHVRNIYGIFNNKDSKPLCPLVPPGLNGTVKINKTVPTWTEIETRICNLVTGGRFKPLNCTARNKIAIIIPFRERRRHLRVLLKHLHPFLQKQLHDYVIYVVEQERGALFNTGMMKNIGFTIARHQYDFDCFIFHDVDYLPEDDRIAYSCSNVPHHLAVRVDKWNYQKQYNTLIGGVIALTKDQFLAVNGFSNIMFGWGGDDDDLYSRIKSRMMTFSRYMDDISRYSTLKHPQMDLNPKRDSILKTSQLRMETDGLNSLHYTLLGIEYLPLFTKILVRVNETEVMDSEPIHKKTFDVIKEQK